jgi:hypothetical protein
MPLTRKNGAGSPKLWTPRPFRILAIDPGGTTGWAKCEYKPHPYDEEITLDDFKFDFGHIGPEEHHDELWDFLLNKEEEGSIPLELVCESFQFRYDPRREKAKVELISCEYIGLVKLFAARYELPLTLYTASSAKDFIPDKGPQANVKLKQLGWYRPVTRWVHAMDATRHLLKYMVFNKRIRNPITDKWLGD